MLKGRVARLEQAFRPDRFRNITEFRFADSVTELPPGTVIPEGARVVSDFFEDHHFDSWGGRPGVAFRCGSYRQRVTVDPIDQRRIMPAAEDPVLQEILNADANMEQPKPKPESEFITPEEVLAMCEE